MSAPATPTGFYLVSAQSQVLLYWEAAATATSYLVFRSADNVSFTQIGTTTSLQYSDSTGTVGTVYYYNIEATNGLASAPTPTLSGIPLLIGQTTVGNISLICRQQSDNVNNGYFTSQEMNSYVNLSYKELYDLLIQKFGNDYYMATPYSFVTGGSQFYALPADFYKLYGVDVQLNSGDPTSRVTLKNFQFIQRNLWNYPNVYTYWGVTNLRYRLEGNNLYLVPITAAGNIIWVWYAPKPNQLINDTDTLDMISGWEEYIVADVCIKMQNKQEGDASIFMAQKAALKLRIEEAAENRDIGQPQTVSDTKRINFAWADGDYGAGSGGGMY